MYHERNEREILSKSVHVLASKKINEEGKEPERALMYLASKGIYKQSPVNHDESMKYDMK
jgi:hypothetical protein